MPNPFTRVNLRDRLRVARARGWSNLLPVGVIVLSGLFAWPLFARGVDMFKAEGPGGIAGTVFVDHCEAFRTRQASGWTCEGTFVSYDGRVRVDDVQVFPYFSGRPTGPVAARVASATSHRASRGTGWAWITQIGGGLALVAFGCFVFYRVYLRPSPSRQGSSPG